MAKSPDATEQLSLAKEKSGRWSHLLKEFPVATSETRPSTAEAELPLPLDEPEESTSQEKIYSVSEINKAIKGTLEGQFAYVWLQGEISNFKAHTSGHFYFSLKDEKAQISAVMFRGFNGKLKFRPESGMEVLVRGKITVYEPRGNYQVFCEYMEPVGAGALQKAFEQLKAKLQSEGLFEQDHKQSLPEHPTRVAVVTSPTGAAIRDILNVLSRRSKRVQVTVIPARVQGDIAASEVVRGIELANQIDQFDVMIVGRGGGSIEDLWCFNEEPVARAIFASKIPIISAVGHEIDFTIADFVADLRAPTPSAAAELVAQSEEQLRERLSFLYKTMTQQIYQHIRQQAQLVKMMTKGLKDPRVYLRDSMLRADELVQRLQQAINNRLDRQRLHIAGLRGRLPSPLLVLKNLQLRLNTSFKSLHSVVAKGLETQKNRLQHNLGMLDSLSPLKVVERGYGIVRKNEQVVRSTAQIKTKDKIEIQLSDGQVSATVNEIKGGKK